MRALIILMAATSMGRAACVQVPRDRILLSDLAALLPIAAGDQVSPALVALTPDPGTHRVLGAEELQNVARKNGISIGEAEVHDICVERATVMLDEAMIRDSLSRMAELANAEIRIIDFSKVQVPNGELRFSMANLPRPPAGDPVVPVTWRGRLLYDDRRTVAVWVKVALSRAGETVRAIQDIPRGTEISAGMVEPAAIREFPVPSQHRPTTLAEVIGRSARRLIRAGETIDRSSLQETQLIAPGQSVHVTVELGELRLTFEREAASAGQLGQTVLLRDKTSGKVLRAVTNGKGTAVLRLGGGDRS